MVSMFAIVLITLVSEMAAFHQSVAEESTSKSHPPSLVSYKLFVRLEIAQDFRDYRKDEVLMFTRR